MDEKIKELIAQYHLVFNNHRDTRLTCTSDREAVHCYGIDEIEMCVYCIMRNAGGVYNLKWEIQENGGKYYFIPVIDGKCFRDALCKLMEKYPLCEEDKSIYLEKGKLKPLYKVCQGELLIDEKERSCNIVTDMIFNLNQSNRDKEDLDNFCALFCCYNVSFLYTFLEKVNVYIEENIKRKRDKVLQLFNDVTLFMEKIFSFRECIINYNENIAEDDAYLRKLKETSMMIAKLLREREKSDELTLTQYQNMPLQFNIKVKANFPMTKRGWNYKARLGSQGSCQQLFRHIAYICTKNEIEFLGEERSGEEDLKTVRDFLAVNVQP